MAILYTIGALLLVGMIYAIFDHFRMKRLALKRGKPNICEYARSFDYRNVDTSIIREVWKEVQDYLGSYNGTPFPVQADDLFEDTYNLHTDDLDEIYWTVADRLAIDTEKPEENPYFNQVTSVRNLVMFLHHQPRTGNS
ncbi:hypothetical protein [Microbulbifer celer]|uniref:Uncharacterized protein n=1 Tax=Microbulbifer celer TaxID=435905 RepID=A0ABW3U7N0_9GAMM|nr:hypothetical protein [Microbulbifer celer]UFN58715.1 hypothetical protein LPW13_06645 [Microbulbifer celer]